MRYSGTAGEGRAGLVILDLALILQVCPADLVRALTSAGYRYHHPLHPISYVSAERILQRFEIQSLQRPRRRDPVGAGIPEHQNKALHAQREKEAQAKLERPARRKRKSRAEKELLERQRVEEQRARQKARAAEFRQRPPLWDETYAERDTNSTSSRPAAGYRLPAGGITRLLSAGAPGLGRRS